MDVNLEAGFGKLTHHISRFMHWTNTL